MASTDCATKRAPRDKNSSSSSTRDVMAAVGRGVGGDTQTPGSEIREQNDIGEGENNAEAKAPAREKLAFKIEGEGGHPDRYLELVRSQATDAGAPSGWMFPQIFVLSKTVPTSRSWHAGSNTPHDLPVVGSQSCSSDEFSFSPRKLSDPATPGLPVSSQTVSAALTEVPRTTKHCGRDRTQRGKGASAVRSDPSSWRHQTSASGG